MKKKQTTDETRSSSEKSYISLFQCNIFILHSCFPSLFLLLAAHAEPPPSHCQFIHTLLLSVSASSPSFLFVCAPLPSVPPFHFSPFFLFTPALSLVPESSRRRETSVSARERTIIEKCLRHHVCVCGCALRVSVDACVCVCVCVCLVSALVSVTDSGCES